MSTCVKNYLLSTAIAEFPTQSYELHRLKHTFYIACYGPYWDNFQIKMRVFKNSMSLNSQSCVFINSDYVEQCSPGGLELGSVNNSPVRHGGCRRLWGRSTFELIFFSAGWNWKSFDRDWKSRVTYVFIRGIHFCTNLVATVECGIM
jgi:hypothetical protein